MHIDTFDHYQNQESLIHERDPRVKVVITLAFILSNVLLPDGAWLAFGYSWCVVLLVSWLARLDFRFLFSRSLVALPFALAAVTAVFALPGETIWALRIGSWQLNATDTGLIRFSSILLRSWVSIQMAIVLTASTPFPDLIHALRHLKTPDILVSTISFMYRYMFVLSDEALRMLRAREARSARTLSNRDGGSIAWRARITGNMAGQLFLRSYERSERVYNAMLARGYQGTLLTLNPHHMQLGDWVAGGVGLLILILIQWMSRV